MVKLTSALASRKGSKSTSKSAKNEEQILKKRTHLYLQNKSITEIEDLSMCKNLAVLYLQDNLIEDISNLHYVATLTHLYLQNNKIKKIKNIGSLKSLKKLYLGHNFISVVEGLEELTNLQELHLEKQILPPEVTLTFDPFTIASLHSCLRVLVVSGNGLRSVSPFLALEGLQALRAANNQLAEMAELLSALQAWPQLNELVLQGNPVCSQLRYREKVIAASYHSLDSLDGKHILPVTRSFLQSLAVRQASRSIQPCSARRATAPDLNGTSKNRSLQLAINSKHCTRLPDIPAEGEEPFYGCLFPAWKSGKSLCAKPPSPEHLSANWPPPSARRGRRKSNSSTSTDLSQHLRISRL